MKDQRNSLQNRSVFFTVTAILLMLVISVMGFTAIVSAAEQTEIEVTEENFTLVEGTGMKYENGVYVKGYDGTSDAFLKASDYTDNLPEGVEIIDVTATFVKADGKTAAVNAGEATHVKVNFTFNDGGFNAAGILLPATIVPCEKTSDTIEVTYSPEGIVIDSVNSYALANSLELGVLNAGTHEITTNVLSSDGNYRFTKLSVKVNPVVITSIEWGKTSWVYGEAAVAPEAFDADNNPYGALKVTGKNTTIDGKGVWEKGDVGKYTLTATPINSNYVLADGVANTCNVEITVKKFTVSISDTIKAGDGLNLFFPTVEGIDNPNILGLVEFLNADGSKFEGIKFGTATVTVKLPKSENFVFVDGMGSSELPQTVTVKIGHSQKMFPVYDKSGAQVGNIILVATNEGGFFDDVTVDATAIKGYPKIVKSKYSQVYEIKVNGAAEGETFTVIIPLNDSVYAPRTEGLEAAFYVYNTLSGKLVSASDAGLTATLKDGYYQVGGFSGEATFAIAPDYNAPFFQTVWGILLIIVIILAILTLMCYIGLYLRRIRETEEATTVVIDTVGELPATEAIAEETVEVDADAVIEENLEEAAETVEETAEEVVVDEAELQSAVEESVQDLMDEVAEIELPAEEVTETAAEEAPVEEAAEEVVEEAAEEVIEEAAEVVEEAAEEAPVEEAPVEEVAVAAEVAAEEAPADEEADDNDDDANGDDAVEAVSMVEEEDTSFGFGAGADPSTFVDVKENPEAYQEMLDREARGEIQVVYRYKKSFQSKLAQSQGNVQDYYSELKNALLTFKGVKNRLSWNYEAFNKGRVHVAKMDAKSKTLYLYLALDPTQFNDTKYGVVDVSAKRRYASTPTLIKIKGERKFKHALELIEKLCGEQMELVKTEAENVDYRIERMTIDELVDAGLMKKIAGYVILAPQEDAVPADASVETAPEQN